MYLLFFIAAILLRIVGGTLRTLSLRAPTMYGEQDAIFIPSALRLTKTFNGVLRRIGDGSGRTQYGYVGNVAWAHVLANEALAGDDTLGGGYFFITDDTPPMNMFDFIGQFLADHGFTLSTYSVPFWLVYGLLYATETFLSLLSVVYRINSVQCCASIKHINSTVYFNSKKARSSFGYQPLFTYREALHRSVEFYKGISLA